MSETAVANDKIQALAALVGTTQAELNKLDEDIISSGSGLASANFDGKSIIQKELRQINSQATGQVQPAPQPTPQPVPALPVQTPVPQGHVAPVQPQNTYGGELTVILQKLVSIETEIKGLNERLDSIEYFDKKVVDSLTRGLNNKVKQVTIKLDESHSKQQK